MSPTHAEGKHAATKIPESTQGTKLLSALEIQHTPSAVGHEQRLFLQKVQWRI
jgi:hypothetical protein